LAAAQPLADRGFDPNATRDGSGLSGPQLTVQDALTQDFSDPAVAQRERPKVLPLLQDAAERRYLAPLHRLVTSGRLRNPEGLRPWLDQQAPSSRRAFVERAEALAAQGRDLTLGGADPGAMTDDTTGTGYGTGAPHRQADAPTLVVPPYLGGEEGENKTAGTLVRPDATEVGLVSGWQGPAAAMPEGTAGMNRNTKSHVEAHAAALMWQEGLTEAVLWINRAPCDPSPRGQGCTQLLPAMLPAGATLTLYIVSNGSAWGCWTATRS